MADECREMTLQVLADVAHEAPHFEPSSKRITVPAVEGARTLMEAVRRLDGAGITPQDVTMRRPTLDDVFLSLTGHVAEEGGKEPAATGRRGRRSR